MITSSSRMRRAVWVPIGSTSVLYVSNTDSDALVDIDTQTIYVLLSGRWYASASLEGPWRYVASEDLPASFQMISDDSEIGDLRVHIAGTPEATEAVMDAQVPQTAAVDRGPAEVEIEYDGDPQFEAIPGTNMKYGVNTPQQVLEADGQFFACIDGVWYVSSRATGPWEVSTERPSEVDQIPPDNPSYNVKYVYIYDVTPSVVYVGYTPGYTYTYVYGGTIVYGTGYYYPAWYGTYYYPRHSTWGFHVRWNPWSGWGFGVTCSNGRFTFGIGFGGWGRWGGGLWGPGGYHGYWRGYNRGYYRGARAGYRAGYRRDNIYRAQNRSNVRSGNRAVNVDNSRNRSVNAPSAVSRSAANNVFTDRNGDVFRRDNGGNWERRDGNNWASTGQAQAQRPAQRPSTGGAGSGINRLEHENTARARGTQRSNSFQGSRSGTRSSGARRGWWRQATPAV